MTMTTFETTVLPIAGGFRATIGMSVDGERRVTAVVEAQHMDDVSMIVGKFAELAAALGSEVEWRGEPL